MKHLVQIYLAVQIMLFSTAIPALYADGICDDAISEGKQKYNAGDYQKAKELFEFAQSRCGSTYGDAQSWLDKCNEALTPTTLSVSSASLSFDANGGNQTITVTCNREWSLANTSSDMFTVTRYGNQLTISCITNNSTNSRNGYFDIKSNDGKKSQHISISQLGRQTSSQNNNKNSTQTTSSSSNSRSSSNSGTTNTTTNSTNDPYSPISLILSETSIICGPEGVQGKEIKVYCNRDWSFNKGDENGNYYAYKTDNNQTLVVTVAENKTDRYVYGSIKVYCGAKEATISISQAPKTSGRNRDSNGSSYSQNNSSSNTSRNNHVYSQKEYRNSGKFGYDDFYVLSNYYVVSANGGYYRIDIHCESYKTYYNFLGNLSYRYFWAWTNKNWLEEESIEQDWRKFHVKKNSSNKDREGELYLKDIYGRKITIKVLQKGKGN